MSETWCGLVHGEAGAGKSWLGQTTPAPRLVLDAEGGSRNPKRIGEGGRVERIPQVEWNPAVDPPPVSDGTWESCHVVVRDFTTLEQVYAWLLSGEHPFRSVVLDSLTEIQKRCKDSIKSGLQDQVMTERAWGILLDRMEDLVRGFRDLVFLPGSAIEVVLFLALTKEVNFKFKPAVQGALGVSLPGYVDTVGFLAASSNETTGEDEWRLLIKPMDRFEAKDRTHTLYATYGPVIVNPNVEQMLALLNQEEETA